MSQPDRRLLLRAWRGALALFVLAGLTGVLYRFGIAYGWTAGLDLVNIRHAHSHLMYFGWVTPALMALVGYHLPAQTGRPVPGPMKALLAAAFGAALLSYPPFLALGYTPLVLGEHRLPLSVMAAGLNIVSWYGFVGTYAWWTRGAARSRAMLLWDLALTFLVLATLGAWGLALMRPLGLEDPSWASGLTHVFLDLFSEGWFVLAVLGLFYASTENGERRPASHWSVVMLCLGLPVTFALGMPSVLVPPALKVLAKAGAVLVGVGLLANAGILWRALPHRGGWVWRVPLGLLALKAAAELAAGLVPGGWWGSLAGLRILYLHLMLLGFVTLGLVAAASAAWGRPAAAGRRVFYGAVLALLASLLPLTTVWPVAWQGRWAFVAAAWVALLPVLSAAALLAGGLRSQRAVAREREAG